MADILGALKDPQFRADVLRNLRDVGNRSAASFFGGPVDLATMFMRPFGYQVPDREVFGSSEYLGKQMEQRGMVGEARNPTAEFIGSLAIPGAIASSAPRIFAAEQAAIRNAMVPQTLNPQTGAVLFHGTPHRFASTPVNPLGEFRASQIGTGEGAQAYGYGTYFAESPGVAKSYQTTLTMDRGFNFGGQSGLTREQLQDLVNAREGNKYLDGVTKPSGVADQVIDSIVYGKKGELPRSYKAGSERAALFEKLKQEISHTDKGSLYTVDIPDEMVGKMLDWDKRLSEQPMMVQDAIKKIARTAKPFDIPIDHNPTGAEFYGMLSAPTEIGGRGASQMFKDMGIPGIRYLDQGSRGAGDGTRNIVVFPGEEQSVKILSRE
jgi:hypothetical protein